jgi:hypothetical protein
MSEAIVKPLEWDGPESRVSEGGILRYWVGGGTKERLYGGQRTASPLGEFASLDEAKAAAQADYERCILSAINHPAIAAKDAEIARLREARDLLSDWIVEGTEDLPDDTPVTIKIGNRSIILDELKNLRAALKEPSL